MTPSPKTALIGAGSSGIAAAKALHERGIDFDCFEKGSGVGGNWRYGNDNGMSSAYRSLHINTSRNAMAYAKFPMPEDYPDYPNHFQIAKYFDDYVDHFGFRDRIRFETGVEHEHHLAVLLDPVLVAHRTSDARRRLPVDLPDVVVGEVVADRLEVGAEAQGAALDPSRFPEATLADGVSDAPRSRGG